MQTPCVNKISCFVDKIFNSEKITYIHDGQFEGTDIILYKRIKTALLDMSCFEDTSNM